MSSSRQILRATGVITVLATGALALTAFAAAATKYDNEATQLDTTADRHARMAELYEARASGGSKQGTAFLSLAQHCERLSKTYHQAAAAAHATAQVHRDMAKAG